MYRWVDNKQQKESCNSMKNIGLTLLAVLVAFGSFATQTSLALPPFKKAFTEKYADKEESPDFNKVVRKAGCNACHVKGEKDKHVKNEYGVALDKLIKGDAKHRIEDAAKESDDAKKAMTETIMKELDVAFEKAAEMKNKDGVKFGDLLKEKKLPTPVITKEEYEKAKKDHDGDHHEEGDHDHEDGDDE